MWLLGLIFLVLVAARKSGGTVENSVLSLCLFVSVFHLLGLAGIGFAFNAAADIGGLLLIGVLACAPAVRRLRGAGGVRFPDAGAIAAAAFPLAAFAFLEALHRPSHLLPLGDPVAVPVFSTLLHDAARIPATLEPLSDAVYSYPPGYSILLAPLHGFVGPVAFLGLYKHLNLLTVALTPAAWAFALRRTLGLDRVGTPALVFCFYAGFFVLDRSLFLGLHLAGKNAQLFCSLLFPAVFVVFAGRSRGAGEFVLRALAGAGLILIHYSALYMLALSLSGHYAVRARGRVAEALRSAAALAVAAAIVAPQLMTVGRSGVRLSGSASAWDLPGLAAFLKAAWLARCSHLLFIFEDLGCRWPYKGVALMLCAGGAILLMRALPPSADSRREASRAPLTGGLLSLSITAAAASVVASGFFPDAGINADYVRWLLFNYTAAIFSLGLAAAWLALPAAARHSRLGVLCAFAAVALLGASWLKPDLAIVRDVLKRERVPAARLERMRAAVAALDGARTCSLFVRNTAAGTPFVRQPLPELDYLPLFSACVIRSGTWVTPALPGSFEVDGLPAERLVEERLGRGERVFLVAPAERLGAYETGRSQLALLPPLGDIGGLQVREVRSLP